MKNTSKYLIFIMLVCFQQAMSQENALVYKNDREAQELKGKVKWISTYKTAKKEKDLNKFHLLSSDTFNFSGDYLIQNQYDTNESLYYQKKNIYDSTQRLSITINEDFSSKEKFYGYYTYVEGEVGVIMKYSQKNNSKLKMTGAEGYYRNEFGKLMYIRNTISPTSSSPSSHTIETYVYDSNFILAEKYSEEKARSRYSQKCVNVSKYNPSGYVVSYEQRNEKGGKFILTKYEYDKKDNLVKVLINYFDLKGNEIPNSSMIVDFKYDRKNMIVSKKVNNLLHNYSYVESHSYKYDRKGNWIQLVIKVKLEEEEVTSVLKREIEYY